MFSIYLWIYVNVQVYLAGICRIIISMDNCRYPDIWQFVNIQVHLIWHISMDINFVDISNSIQYNYLHVYAYTDLDVYNYIITSEVKVDIY